MAKELMSGDRLKQRLVGGIALLLIGAIAWFWLLSADSPVDPVARTSEIPPAPAIQPFNVPEPTAPAGVSPIGSERDSAPAARSDAAGPIAAAPTPAQPAPEPAAQPAAAPAPAAQPPVKPNFELDQHNLPVAWVVQVGSFSTQANADKMKKTLQEKGFKAYTEKMKNGSAIKVYVGPKLSRERADAQKKAIDQALKLNTMVVRFPTL